MHLIVLIRETSKKRNLTKSGQCLNVFNTNKALRVDLDLDDELISMTRSLHDQECCFPTGVIELQFLWYGLP